MDQGGGWPGDPKMAANNAGTDPKDANLAMLGGCLALWVLHRQ